jgi:hypothetical protein
MFLSQFHEGARNDDTLLEHLNRKHFEEFSNLVEQEHIHNPWFTRQFVLRAVAGISRMLDRNILERWLTGYPLMTPSPDGVKIVGTVMAGNIPLVGFHDLMSIVASGHKMLAKPSGKDERLPKKLVEVLSDIDDELAQRIRFAEERLKGIDALIATGSNNTARYFEYYFRDIPHIIRSNRNGVAVLTGKESESELEGLGEDIFTYFGMGCRNVTKLYIPDSYDLKVLMGVFDRYHDLYQHYKYGNNVDYYRSIYLMNGIQFLDNGVLLLKEDPAIASPVGVVFYERYSDIGWVQDQLEARGGEIQCCVSVSPGIQGAIPPGSTQDPMPWDYADGVDTLRFLTELK